MTADDDGRHVKAMLTNSPSGTQISSRGGSEPTEPPQPTPLGSVVFRPDSVESIPDRRRQMQIVDRLPV
jgi:hypothetical protein